MIDRIRAARRAHEALRAEQPNPANQTAKSEVYKDLKALYDELWAAVDGSGPATVEVRRAIRLLTVDAEYYAGLNDSEGFRDPAEVWDQYELLERSFA